MHAVVQIFVWKLNYIYVTNPVFRGKFRKVIETIMSPVFVTEETIHYWEFKLISCEIMLSCMTKTSRWLLNIGSGNGLVPSGDRPFYEPRFTQNSVPIWQHYATVG